ncbi:MAG: hypothetical protein WDN48_05105 [Pseudolabrys sp.]
MVINNYGQILSNIGSAANGNASGNDSIDFNDANGTGTVNNYSTGLISSARHGITANQGIAVLNYGTIIGNDGSGINIDSTTNPSITTVTNYGSIIGTAKTADGDGLDVDHLLTLNNYGTIKGLGTGSGGNLSEGLAIGGGTVNNYAGALIYSDQRAITVDDSSLGNAFGTVAINNAGTIRGASGEAVKITSNLSNTLTNSGAIFGGVFMGNATGGNFNTVTILPGPRLPVWSTAAQVQPTSSSTAKWGLRSTKRPRWPSARRSMSAARSIRASKSSPQYGQKLLVFCHQFADARCRIYPRQRFDDTGRERVDPIADRPDRLVQ